LLLNVLPLTAVLRRRCCWAPAAVDRYLPLAGPAAANPPHVAAVALDGTNRDTDGHRAHIPEKIEWNNVQKNIF